MGLGLLARLGVWGERALGCRVSRFGASRLLGVRVPELSGLVKKQLQVGSLGYIGLL